MGHVHLTTGKGVSTSRRRLGWRSCLQKGCGRGFQARQYKQRYCQHPECLAEVRRWQGAKRQRKCRSQAEGRLRHAEAERQRRKEQAFQAQKPPESESVATDMPAEPCAWSRNRKYPAIFCNRPGCYESPRYSPRVPASYCGDDCCAAMRRVRDREHKWLRRKTKVGQFKRHLEYQAARAKLREGRVASGDMVSGQPLARSNLEARTVLFYWSDNDPSLDLSTPKEVISHDPQTHFSSRSRAPPAS